MQLESVAPPVTDLCDHSKCDNCWTGYPQSRFPTWTPSQVLRSKIADAVENYDRKVPCRVHHVDVNSDGYFTNAEILEVPEERVYGTWEELKHHVVSSSISPTNSIRFVSLCLQVPSHPSCCNIMWSDLIDYSA